MADGPIQAQRRTWLWLLAAVALIAALYIIFGYGPDADEVNPNTAPAATER